MRTCQDILKVGRKYSNGKRLENVESCPVPNVKLLKMVDAYKYDAGALMSDLAESPDMEQSVRELLQPIAERAPWPSELRSWKALLFGLIGSEIGGIASPLLRDKAADILFSVAEQSGISRSAIEMIASNIGEIRRGLTSNVGIEGIC
jgi:hypothetical protein